MPTENIAARLEAVRAALKKQGLDGFVIPITDEHASEYVAEYAQRLAWISNFKGSAGTGVVMLGKAAIFVDGRYTIQVRQQVDEALFEYCHLIDNPPIKWLKTRAKKGQKIGYDPFLHTIGWVASAKKALATKSAELVATNNVIDAAWDDQPGEPNT
ncbi:MAG: aminopeptidase P family N-terminal domain-containing protein, partial [Sphingomonadales bacterium]